MEQPVNTSPPLEKGAQLGQYTILGRLGAGGMGEVYRARDTRLSRDVAIKVLPSFLSKDPDRLRRFELEARAAAALNHPNILAVYQMGTYEGAPYLVSELLEGSTLREQLSRGPLPLRKVIDYGVQIARGLAAAHEKGIVHRDLKPENLFVAKDGRVKVLDFGLAKVTEPNWPLDSKAATVSRGTEPGVVMGTVGYMAPEQVSGKAADHRADIFAFGAVLYEMLTGKRAFQKPTSVETMSAILNEEPPAVSQFAPTSPPALQRVVQRCLDKSPQQRFQSASDLAFALEALTESESARVATNVVQPDDSRKAIRARGWLALAGLALAALLALAYAGYRDRTEHAGRPRVKSLAVLPLKNLSGDPRQEYLADGMTEALIGRLSEIHDLRVISRTSVMRFRDPQISVPEIARTLGVDAIVEGSTMREGNRIRVTAQLIRGATDEHFWSETYDRELQDALTLQSDLAQSIAEKVEATVTGEEHQRLTATRSVAPEVYESYLKGRFTLNKGNSRADFEKSIGYFEGAIKQDPTFAPAYVGLAEAYTQLGTVFAGSPDEETRPKVMNAARKALELDPDIAEAYVLLAGTLQKEWQWAEAETEYKRALELSPNDAGAHEGFAYWLLCQGRTDEAVAWAQRGRELDPVTVSGDSVALILFFSHRYAESIHESRSVLAVRPDEAAALTYLGFALVANNQPVEAISVLEKAVSISNGSPAATGVLIRAYAHAGRRSDALRLLAELNKRRKAGYVPTGAFVNAYLGLGENEEAFVWLEQAYKERSNILQFVKVHPFFDSIRNDPRFADLVRRVGLDKTPTPTSPS
jgi:serine/threonine protein kinase